MSFFASDLNRDKLVLLYFFNATNFELTNEQITRIAIENDWCSYFDLQQSLAELASSGLLALVNRPAGACYGISEAGRHTLNEFSARLTQSLRDSIDDYICLSRSSLKENCQHMATFSRIGTGEYIVSLKIVEGPIALMTMTINVVSKEIAAKLCKSWQKRAQDVYAQTLETLTAD